MQIQLTPTAASRLTRLAAVTGNTADVLASKMIDHGLDALAQSLTRPPDATQTTQAPPARPATHTVQGGAGT